MIARSLKVLLIVLTTGLLSCVRAGDKPLLIHGGVIYTGVKHQPKVEAVLVRDGKVAFAGDLNEARSRAGHHASIDLKGAVAYPGFVDAHAHLAYLGLSARSLELSGASSLQDTQQRLRQWAKTHPSGAITGFGWIETHWPEKRFPTRADLDVVEPRRPVLLTRADGHAAVANSTALALARIDRDTPDPAGGRIERDDSGEATGLLIDLAQELVQARLPSPSPPERRAALKAAAELYAARGWTGMHDMGMDWQDVALLEDLAAQEELPIRVDSYIRQADAERIFASGQRTDPTGLVRLRGIKLLMDGALGSRGAALFEPYADAPSNAGLLLISATELNKLLRRARRARLQVAIHAIGDRGNRLALDAFERTFSDAPAQARDARWRVEHAQILAPADIPRFARIGAIASMQPSHAISDLHFAPARLGPDRLVGAYAWRSLLNSGAVIAAGSDAPVEKGDPLIEFYAAIDRHDLEGFSGPDWQPGQAVGRHDALRMLTWGPAYAVARDDVLGTLEVGKCADISVFSIDLLSAAPRDIPKAHAVMTIVDGRVVYRANESKLDFNELGKMAVEERRKRL